MQNNLPNTKIIATIGPSTWDADVIREMISHGLTVARINASHADVPEIQRMHKFFRDIDDEIILMLDTKGHEIRTTGYDEKMMIKTGSKIQLVGSEYHGDSTEERIKLTYKNFSSQVKAEDMILLDDGYITLKVEGISGEFVNCIVIDGGELGTKKGLNVPKVSIDFGGLSEKDIEDITAGVELGYDWVAASFIRNVNDVKEIREVIGDSDIKIIAKIENGEGVDNFDEILEIVDGVMVARGDMGVEVPLEQVPAIQKMMVYKCRNAGKPVIVATQMLESMKTNPYPTRAETSDVANAVYDGTDAVMLSAETSVGDHPIGVVEVMARIAKETEKEYMADVVVSPTNAGDEVDEIARHGFEIAESLELDGVIIKTDKIETVGSIARHRRNGKLWVVTSSYENARKFRFYRGVITVVDESKEMSLVGEDYGLEKGQKVVIITDMNGDGRVDLSISSLV